MQILWPCMKVTGNLILVVVVALSLCGLCLAEQYEDLWLTWIGVVDNLEGDGSHGPSGSLWLNVYDGDGRRIVKRHLGSGINDGDEIHLETFLGTIGIDGLQAIGVTIWESDTMNPAPGFLPLGTSDWGGFFGRKHDVAATGWIGSGGLYRTTRPARADAIANTRTRRPGWVTQVWHGPIRSGIPTIWFRVEGRPSAFGLSDAVGRDPDDATGFDDDDVRIDQN